MIDFKKAFEKDLDTDLDYHEWLEERLNETTENLDEMIGGSVAYASLSAWHSQRFRDNIDRAYKCLDRNTGEDSDRQIADGAFKNTAEDGYRCLAREAIKWL